MSTILFGIPNCDTVKKAQRWLDDAQHTFEFHDFRKDGLEQSQVSDWVNAFGWENVLNKRSTSWRALSDDTKSNMDNDAAIECILQSPTLIKRPVLCHGKTVHFGFKAADYETIFSK